MASIFVFDRHFLWRRFSMRWPTVVSTWDLSSTLYLTYAHFYNLNSIWILYPICLSCWPCWIHIVIPLMCIVSVELHVHGQNLVTEPSTLNLLWTPLAKTERQWAFGPHANALEYLYFLIPNFKPPSPLICFLIFLVVFLHIYYDCFNSFIISILINFFHDCGSYIPSSHASVIT